MHAPPSEEEILKRSRQIVRLGAVMLILVGALFGLSIWSEPAGWHRTFALVWSPLAILGGIRMLVAPDKQVRVFADLMRRSRR